MELFSATLKPREERRLLRGHLWAYRNEFEQIPEMPDGAVVDVFTSERRFVGRGFFQRDGGIAARLLTSHQEPVDTAFFRARLNTARALRECLFPGQTAYRWIFGESDGLPGLVLDRYGALAVLHTSCAFYAQWLPALAEMLLETPDLRGVISHAPGGAQSFGDVPDEIQFDLEGLHLAFAPKQTQKTGLFLDQRLNRLTVRPFAPGKRVLDGHCYHGLWACHAAQAGAAHVLGVDTSEDALAHARANAERNGVADRCEFEPLRVEAALEREESWDLIVLDPPAYAKARAQEKKATGLYQALNAAAMHAIAPGGILITSSCSHFVDAPAFLEIIKRAAATAKRRVLLLETRGAAPDHPILLAMPETAYLKCVVLQVE